MSRDPVEGWWEQQAIAKLASWSWWEQSLSGEPSQLLTLVQWQTVCRSGVRVTMIYSGQSITKLSIEAGTGVWSSWTWPLHIVTDHSHLGTEVLLTLSVSPFPAASQLTVSVNWMEWIAYDMQMTSYRQWSLRLRLCCPYCLNRSQPNFIALLSTTQYGVLTSYSLRAHDPVCKWCHISSSGGFLLVMRASSSSSSSCVSVSCPDKSWTLVLSSRYLTLSDSPRWPATCLVCGEAWAFTH